MKKYLFIFLACYLLLSSCSSTKEMQVLVTRPALFEIPDNIKNIVIVNRSKGGVSTVLEGVLTGEVPGREQILAERSLSGLMQTLMLNKKLNISRYEMTLNADRGLSSGFGNALPWELVQEIANQYNADAVLALEFFDTDFSIRDASDLNRTGNFFYIRGFANASAGFRLYYPIEKSVLYERNFSYSDNYTEFAPTRALAIAKLIKGTDALNNLSYDTGQSFARRLTAYKIWEDRLMYKGKKNAKMTKGERNVLTNNWQEGVNSWLIAYQDTNDSETKGKIAYNLALGYEVLGELQEAKKWITVSYVDHGDKKAQDYAQTINSRIENESILQQQGIK